ncbi:MAG: hypothetical protein ABI867_18355 [Kofleriaceae bacterium]
MRSLLITALALSAVPASSEACGDYSPGPHVFMVSSHYTREGTRSFVVLDANVPQQLRWTMLAPGTYDGSNIAPAQALAHDRTFTLVGPEGRSIVTSRARWYLDSAWEPRGKATVLEVTAKHGAEIALAGSHTDASWIALDSIATTQRDVTWIAAQGSVAELQHISVRRVHGTSYETLSAYLGDGEGITFVRDARSHQNLGRLDGHALGGLAMNGRTFVLGERAGIVSRIEL